MKPKAKRLEVGHYEYRGFRIERNYESANGTWRTCKSQQGWRVFPATDYRGDWAPSITEAVKDIDRLYQNFHGLTDEARWQVVSGIRRLRSEQRS